MRIVRNPADGVQKDTVYQEKGILLNNFRRVASEDDRILNRARKNGCAAHINATHGEAWEVGTQVVLINLRTPSLVPATIAKKMESRDKLRNQCYRYNLTLENGETVWNVEAWRLRQRKQNSNGALGGTAMSPDFSVPQMAEKKKGSNKAEINGSVKDDPMLSHAARLCCDDDCRADTIDNASFREGSAVEVNFRNMNVWYSGRVQSVNTDGTYNIHYNEGMLDMHVPAVQLRQHKADFAEIASLEMPANNIPTIVSLSSTPDDKTSLLTVAGRSKWKRCYEIGASVTVLHLRTQLWWSGKITWASPLYDRYNVHLDDTNEIITNVHAMLVDGPSDDSGRVLSRVYTEYVKKHRTLMVHTRTSYQLKKAAAKTTVKGTVEATSEDKAKVTVTSSNTPTIVVTRAPVPTKSTSGQGVQIAIIFSFWLGIFMVLFIQRIFA